MIMSRMMEVDVKAGRAKLAEAFVAPPVIMHMAAKNTANLVVASRIADFLLPRMRLIRGGHKDGNLEL